MFGPASPKSTSSISLLCPLDGLELCHDLCLDEDVECRIRIEAGIVLLTPGDVPGVEVVELGHSLSVQRGVVLEEDVGEVGLSMGQLVSQKAGKCYGPRLCPSDRPPSSPGQQRALQRT